MKLEDELTKAQDELKALRAEYEEYVYVVSHDLVAPLRQIEGFSSIIYAKYADQFDEKTKRHFGLIVSGAEKGKNILEALLNYSRLNTEAKPFASVNCSQVIEEVTSQLSSLIESSAADVTHPNIPVVVGDSAQIYQVFYHIIHNALHYRFPESRPQISIEAQEVDDHWQFCVKDNGIGIPNNLTDKIFIILRRAVTDKKYSGIGMGLAIAKHILQRHGGRIWVASEKNTGSSFYFTISKDLHCVEDA